jgi:hypothetical protein
MPNCPRPRRVALPRARVQLSNTVANVVDVSRSGVLVQAGDALRSGSEWPLVLELPAVPPVRVTGRVARCESADVSLPGGAVLRSQYLLAFAFIDLPGPAVAVLDQVCGTTLEF